MRRLNDRYEDPTQGITIGHQPDEDPTRGREVGSDPEDDPTQGREVGSDPYEDPRELARPRAAVGGASSGSYAALRPYTLPPTSSGQHRPSARSVCSNGSRG